MTTLSVREFVQGIYRKLNLDPAAVRKMQTGGPDGDLGSNEILLSNEKYTSIGEYLLPVLADLGGSADVDLCS